MSNILEVAFALPPSEGIDGVLDCLSRVDLYQTQIGEMASLIGEEVDAAEYDDRIQAMLQATLALLKVTSMTLNRAQHIAIEMRKTAPPPSSARTTPATPQE